jgi:CMP/dCMP kinase
LTRIIAIDGPSGAGKSTISKILAQRLGFGFLDTGALYRGAALFLTHQGIPADAPDYEIEKALKYLEITFSQDVIYINSSEVSNAIRTPEAGHAASVFSARAPVRAFLLDMQRSAAADRDIVAEGRDMTTVVFPDAWRKFFLDASESERAHRRYLQMLEKGQEITLEEALSDVRNRDIRDSSRDLAPLKRAADAVYIDTTNLTMTDVISCMIAALQD